MTKACLFILILSSVSCERFEFKELNPSFLKVDRIEFNSPSGQKISHNIKDLWLFIDDGYAGTFSVPVRIPVLEHGVHKIALYPGIRFYGISSKPEIYSLVNEFRVESDFQTHDSITLLPTFSYKSNVITALQENFESSSIFIHDLDSFKQNTLIRSDLRPRDGKYSGYGLLNAQHPLIEIASNSVQINSSSKKSAYLEVDVISDTEVQIGLQTFIGNSTIKTYFLSLLPTSDWKKIYIPLFEIIQDHDGDAFQLLIRSELKSPATQAYFFIDNIKWISLP